jgi:hypothetical protein
MAAGTRPLQRTIAADATSSDRNRESGILLEKRTLPRAHGNSSAAAHVEYFWGAHAPRVLPRMSVLPAAAFFGDGHIAATAQDCSRCNAFESRVTGVSSDVAARLAPSALRRVPVRFGGGGLPSAHRANDCC